MTYFLPLLLAVAGDEPAPRLPVIRQAPDFSLVSQDEKPCKLADQRGKVVLVSFIFTTCSGTCPATTHRMARIFHEVQKKPYKDRVHLLSITLDPERDRPEILRGYRKLYDIESPSWTFVTGPVKDVHKTMADWGMWVKLAAGGQLDHPSRVFLLDARGRVREIYNLDFLRLPWVMEDIEELLKE
jgi:protein SCO1/2